MLKLEGREFFRSEAQCVSVEPRSPQPAFPMHDHDFFEIVIVASGNGWHVLNGEPHLLSCGELLYLGPGDRHAFEQVQDLYLTNVIYRPSGSLSDPERLLPYLQPSELQPRCGATGEPRYWQVSAAALQALGPLLAALKDESRRSDVASSLMAESLLGQLVVTLWRERYAIDGHGLSDDGRLAQVLKFLRQNCTEPIDLDELARRYGYSTRNLRRVFREATATTPHDYLVKLRLCRAIRALGTSDDSITDVALASGFSDGNYFSYAFRKLTGMSPSRYRREVGAVRRKDDASALA